MESGAAPTRTSWAWRRAAGERKQHNSSPLRDLRAWRPALVQIAISTKPRGRRRPPGGMASPAVNVTAAVLQAVTNATNTTKVPTSAPSGNSAATDPITYANIIQARTYARRHRWTDGKILLKRSGEPLQDAHISTTGLCQVLVPLYLVMALGYWSGRSGRADTFTLDRLNSFNARIALPGEK